MNREILNTGRTIRLIRNQFIGEWSMNMIIYIAALVVYIFTTIINRPDNIEELISKEWATLAMFFYFFCATYFTDSNRKAVWYLNLPASTGEKFAAHIAYSILACLLFFAVTILTGEGIRLAVYSLLGMPAEMMRFMPAFGVFPTSWITVLISAFILWLASGFLLGGYLFEKLMFQKVLITHIATVVIIGGILYLIYGNTDLSSLTVAGNCISILLAISTVANTAWAYRLFRQCEIVKTEK